MRIRTLAFALVLLTFLAMPLLAQQSSTVGAFTLTFNGVSYDGDLIGGTATSTWSYSLVWNGTPPALSHLVIGFCNTGVTLVSATPPPTGLGGDPTTGIHGIKWDIGGPIPPLVAGVPFNVTFTLSKPYAVSSVQWAPKAGPLTNGGLIYGPSCELVNPSIAITKSCPPEAFVGDVLSYGITVTNDGNVELSNVVISDPGATPDSINVGSLAAGATFSATVTRAATAGSITNTASVSGSYFGFNVSDSSACTTNVFDPTIDKTAATSYDRDYDWSVVKTFDGEGTQEICANTTAHLAFSVTAERTTVDSPYMVNGSIQVHNPATTLALTLDSVADVLPGASVTLDCATAFPASIAAGGTLQCTYSAVASSLDPSVNTGTAVYATSTRSADAASALGTRSISDTADVIFGDPATVTDAVIEVADLVTCPAGFLCSAAGPFQFSGSGTQNFEIDVTNDAALCDTYYTLTNAVSWTDDEASHSSSVNVEIYTCACGSGCTLTIGYWKTHAGFTGNNADRVTQYLPVSLGSGGGKTVVVDDAAEAVMILNFGLGEPSNGVTKLYAQLLAAKLNIANGATTENIDSVIPAADAFLVNYDQSDWASFKKPVKAQVLTWMTLLDAYNNGDIGPGHCD